MPGDERMRTQGRLEQNRRTDKARPGNFLVYLLFMLFLLVGAFLFINSPYFLVGSVSVEGVKYLLPEEVKHSAGINDQVNIFRLDTAEIQKRLSQDLRIEEAKVFRRLPATVVISVRERQPLAYIASDYGFVQVDRKGVVLTALKNIKNFDVPIITGVSLGSMYVGDCVGQPAVTNVLVYLAALDEATLNQFSEVNIKASGELTVYTMRLFTIRLGHGERLQEKARLTADILRDIGDKKAAVEYIDLNYASPYIKFKQ